MINALFPVAQREVCIGAEAEQRGRIVFQIVIQILHFTFLVGSQQSPDGIAQLHSPVFQIFQGIEAQHAGALVVHYTTAYDKALPAAQSKGVLAPACAGHHIQMSDGSQIFLPLPHLGITYHIFAVDGIQAQLSGYLQPQLQSFCGAGAKRHSRLLLSSDTVNGHKPAYIPDYSLPIFPGKELNILNYFLIHNFSFPAARGLPGISKFYLPLNILLKTVFCNRTDKDRQKTCGVFRTFQYIPIYIRYELRQKLSLPVSGFRLSFWASPL